MNPKQDKFKKKHVLIQNKHRTPTASNFWELKIKKKSWKHPGENDTLRTRKQWFEWWQIFKTKTHGCHKTMEKNIFEELKGKKKTNKQCSRPWSYIQWILYPHNSGLTIFPVSFMLAFSNYTVRLVFLNRGKLENPLPADLQLCVQ